MFLRILIAVGASLALAGCASIPEDWGRSDVARTVADHGRPAPLSKVAQSRLDALLAQPLEADPAVEIALINNPEIRAEYARLGLAAADVYRFGRLSNPTLSWSRLDPDKPGMADQVTFGLVTSFTDLLLLSARSDLAEAEFARVKLQASSAILNLAAETEGAWYQLAGAELAARMAEAIAKAAATSAELAKRYFNAGNINRLQLALEQAADAEARLNALQAQEAATAARVALNQLLGLGAGSTWTMNAKLPAPLHSEDPLDELLALARDNRLDLAAARKAVEIYAANLEVTENWRWLGAVEIGVETERETDRTRLTGPTLSVELPIFNTHADNSARAQARLLEANAALDTLTKAVENQVQLAHLRVLNAKRQAHTYRESLLPLREEIVQRTQLHYNYMLTGAFELMRAKQQQYQAYQDYLAAVTDYWLARVALTRAVGTALPSGSRLKPPVLDTDDILQPSQAMPGMRHNTHQEPEQNPHQNHHDGGGS